MRRGLGFILLNIVVTAVVAFLVVTLVPSEGDTVQVPVTFPVVVSATPDPNVTPNVIVITATPEPGRSIIPDEIREGSPVADAGPLSTIDPALLNEEGVFEGEADELPPGCIEHSLADGENPALLAVEYDVALGELLAVNDLTEEDAAFLQIGQTLIIPAEGCPLDQFLVQEETEEAVEVVESTDEAGVVLADADAVDLEGEGTAEVTPEATEEPPTVTPTITLAPTAADAQVEIIDVDGVGDITVENVVIRNNGNTVDISGWTLSDGGENVYTIPDGRRLFSGGEVQINTRDGENTPIQFFWGRDEAAFAPGEVVLLTDSDGSVQSSLRLPAGES
jgi:hypothetical protein